MASLLPNSPGDGYGHGTFVGSIAAGAAPGYAGVAPKAELLSIDVMNDQGQATVADIIKACDFILANKAKYNIKVVNMSLHAVNRASVLFDPLDQAVEKLWLNGIVVVAAAGNYGTPGAPSGVPFAPGNDPFIITVGAADIGSSVKAGDDTVAPFSAYGYTPDGFMKPDIGAPGRYMIGAVPANSVLTKLKPTNVTDALRGYIQLSGTSFAAPVVAATAAMLLAQHPNWTPDQVKGALMLTATKQGGVKGGALGVGDVNVAAARYLYKSNIPNPNAGLDKFVKAAADGTNVFDPAAWQAAAKTNKAWNDAAGRMQPGRMRLGRARHGATWHGPTRPGLRLLGAALPGATSPGATQLGPTRPGLTTPATPVSRPATTQLRRIRTHWPHSSCAIRS